MYQREDKYIPTGGSNKKRKTFFEFDINSDSSETTDLLVKILRTSIIFTYVIIFWYKCVIYVHRIYHCDNKIQQNCHNTELSVFMPFDRN